MDSCNREKEESVILFAGAVIFQNGVVLWPVRDFKFHDFVFLKQRKSDTVLACQMVQDGNSLVLEAAAEPCLQVGKRTDPFAGTDQISDVFHPAVRGTVICIGAEYDVIKKRSGIEQNLCKFCTVGNPRSVLFLIDIPYNVLAFYNVV